jgi:hypothetical protein
MVAGGGEDAARRANLRFGIVRRWRSKEEEEEREEEDVSANPNPLGIADAANGRRTTTRRTRIAAETMAGWRRGERERDIYFRLARCSPPFDGGDDGERRAKPSLSSRFPWHAADRCPRRESGDRFVVCFVGRVRIARRPSRYFIRHSWWDRRSE